MDQLLDKTMSSIWRMMLTTVAVFVSLSVFGALIFMLAVTISRASH